MTIEPWPMFPPEINAGRYEAGTGPFTWDAAAAQWLTFSGLVLQAAAVVAAEAATMGLNWQGTAMVGLGASVSKFMGWLAEMEVIALSNAMACAAVSAAYAAGMTSMIPQPVVTQNRITEAIAEATNFLGINTGLISMLNMEYAQFWGQNGTTMVTYDQAVTMATVPKPINPPPPLASAAGAASELQNAASLAADKSISTAVQSSMQGFQQGLQGGTQGGQSAAQGPGSMAQSMMGSMGQFAQMPQQAMQGLTQFPQQLMQPAQQLMQPLQSLMSGMGGKGLDGAADVGLGGPGAFSALGAGGGGTASAMSGGGGGGVGLGGGLGGAMAPHGAFMGTSSASPARSQQVFGGVSAKPTFMDISSGGAPMGGGGGMGGMGGAHGAGASSAPQRRSEPIYAETEADEEEGPLFR